MPRHTQFSMGARRVQTMTSIVFICPSCDQTFEFDHVGENELVLCPMCGSGFMTIKKGQRLLLEQFEFGAAESSISFEIIEVNTVES